MLPKQVWTIHARLELTGNVRDLALFNLAIASKLRVSDFVKMRVSGLVVGDRVRERVTIAQSKTKKPVQFDVSEYTRESIADWNERPDIRGCRYPSAHQ